MTLVYGASFHDGWRSFAVLVWVLPVAMLSGIIVTFWSLITNRNGC